MNELFRFSSIAEDAFGLNDILGVFVVVFLLFSFIALVCGIANIIAKWKLFEKAGEDVWKSLIPFYNLYVSCQFCGINTMWIWIMLVALCIVIVLPWLSFILTVVVLYFNVLYAVSMARSFGKEEGFAIGLIFLSPIFYLILGFGKSEYVGPRPMNDVILNMFGIENETSDDRFSRWTNTEGEKNAVEAEIEPISKTEVAYCSDCGNKFVEKASYCPNCGNKLDGKVNYCPNCGKKI